MKSKPFSVLALLDLQLKERDALHLNCVAGQRGLNRIISLPDINRPGLALSGFFDAFAYQRIQLFGQGECAFLNTLITEKKLANLERFLSCEIPCCIFSHDLEPPKAFLRLAEQYGCPTLRTKLSSSELMIRLLRVLSNTFAPQLSMHGVLVDVFGLGILLLGDSGIGKSETALELVQRGHRLVADDVVHISCINGNTLLGRGENKLMGHHMEIRGLGIIDVTKMYGIRAVRDQKHVEIVVKLEEWDSQKVYDRIGTNALSFDILDVSLPLLEVPVKPGRNIPVILEAAAMNERLKNMGHCSAKEFNRNILRWIESETTHSNYYSPDDTY